MDNLTTAHNLPIDILNRQEFVDRISDLLETLTEISAPCTLALNGKWGSGKSFVLTMLEHQLRMLQDGEKYMVFHYNCWQYDYYEEPLLALVAAMLDDMDEQSHLFSQNHKETGARVLAAAGSVLKKIAGEFIENKIGVDVSAASEFYDKLRDGQEKVSEKFEAQHGYDHYYAFKQVLNGIKDQLRTLAAAQPLIVVVDELDRCLPDYAIKILERLHHLFSDINKVVVILAIDRNQLDNTVEQIFGSGIDTETYLKKFINLQINLDGGKVNSNFSEKYSNYLALFDKNAFKSRLPIDDYFSALFSGMSIRTQVHIMEKATAIHRLLFRDCQKDYTFMCFELLMAVLSLHPLDNMPFQVRLSQGADQISCYKDIPRSFAVYMENSFNGNCMSVLPISPRGRIQINSSADILALVVYYSQAIYGNDPDLYVLSDNFPRRTEIAGYLDDFRKIQQLLELMR